MTGRAAVLALLATAGFARADCAAGWERRSPMPVPRQEIGVAAIGDVVYAIAGLADTAPSAVVEAYETTTDRWETRAPLPVALHHVMAAAVGDRVYVFGGLSGFEFAAVDSAFAYDPAADAWTERARLPALRGAGAAAVIDGKVYVVGGVGAQGSVSDLARYDPATDAWTPLPSMPTARDHLAAAAIGGKLYAVGGRAGPLFDALEVFDPATGAWTRRAPMPTARGGLGAAAFGGRLFAFGGEGNTNDPLGIFPQTEAYDPARDAWSALPEMGVPRHGIVGAAVGPGIWVPGGGTRQGFGTSGANEVFVPPAGGVLTVRRLVAGGRRLTLRGVLGAATEDPGAATIGVRVLDGDTALLADEVPAGALRANRRRTRWRLPRSAGSAVRSLRLRRRGDDLVVRARVVVPSAPASGATLTVAVDLGGLPYCGEGRVVRQSSMKTGVPSYTSAFRSSTSGL